MKENEILLESYVKKYEETGVKQKLFTTNKRADFKIKRVRKKLNYKCLSHKFFFF